MTDDMLAPQPFVIEPHRRDRLTAISAAVPRRPIVLVLGMHRSGTSLCSHVLSALGVDMADKIAGPGNTSLAPDNPHGHWERWEIVGFHDRILGLFNRDYWGRLHDFALPVAWWADPRVAQIRREMIGFLEERMGEGWFGFKDPRTVRLMPVWHQILRELKLSPRVVFCLRNPAQVARSLQARDGLDPEIGEYRWLVHVVDFYRYASSFDVCTVEYEGWFKDPAANLDKLQQFLDLPWQQSQSDLGLTLAGIVDPGTRHDNFDQREAGQPLVRSLYRLAQRAGQDGGARDQIATIVSQFVGFQQLQRPFSQAFEEIAKTAARYPEIEREAARLNATLAEREAELTEHLGRADELLAALQSAQAQLAARDALLEHTRQAAEERASTAAALQTEVESLREAAAGAVHAGEEQSAVAMALEAEITTLREALAQAEQQAQHRQAAAEALQAELLALRAALVQAEQAGEGHATAVALQTEVAALWETLAQAEREAEDRAIAENGLRGELTAAQGMLMQAECDAQKRADEARMLRGEVLVLRDALAQAERADRERAGQAEATQNEVTALRKRLERTEGEVQQRAVAAETLAAEVGTMRERLAQAERQAQRHITDEAALQAEIVGLQGTLAAAREVGKAAIAAFRIDTVAPRNPDRPRGWRTLWYGCSAIGRMF
jgi:hypothetical protein